MFWWTWRMFAIIWTEVWTLNGIWDYKTSWYRGSWVRVCICLRLDLITGFRVCQTQDKQNWRNKLSVEALQSQSKVFHKAVLSQARKVNIQAISSLSVDIVSRKEYTGFMGQIHSWQKLMQPLWSHWGSASLHQLHLQPSIIHTFLVPISKRNKAELESLCGHWVFFLEWINAGDFKIFSLVQPPTLLFSHKLTVCCMQAGPGTCLHFTQQGPFLTKHIAKIKALSYSLPRISSQAVSWQEKEQHPLIYFYLVWAQWQIIPIDILCMTIKIQTTTNQPTKNNPINPRTLENPISTQNA